MADTKDSNDRTLPMPPLREWLGMSLLLAALISLHVYDLGRQGMRLSITPFIDPAGVIQVTAWDFYNVRRLHEGEFPLWNPLTGLGQPHLANLQTAVFYPLKLPFYITAGLGGHDLYLFLRLLLLGLGPFVLMRALGVGRAGAVFSGIAFGLGGYALWFANLVELNNQVLTPFLMIALVRLGMGYTYKRFLAVASIVTLDIFGGHPEGIFITILFSGLFAIFWVGRSRLPKAVALWCIAGLMGALGAAITLIPFAEYFPRAWNFHFAGMGFMHIGPKAILNAISPWVGKLAGGPLPEIPAGALDMSLTDFYRLPYDKFQLNAGLPYCGLIVIAFMVYALARLKKMPGGAGFFAVFWVCAVSFSMGLFPFKLLSFLPPFHVTNNAKFYFAELTLCSCLLAGMGLDAVFKQGSAKIISIILAAIAGTAIAVSYAYSLDAPEILVQALPAAILIGVLVGARRYRQHAAIALLIAELFIMRSTVKPYLPLDWGKSLSASWLKEIPAGARIQVQDDFLFPPNLGLVAGIADIRSSDAMFPKDYFNWIGRAGGLDEKEALLDFYPRYYTRLNEKALNSVDASIMGVEYVISKRPMPLGGSWEMKKSGDIFIYRDMLADRAVYRLRYPGWKAFIGQAEAKPIDIGFPVLAYSTEGTSGDYVFNYKPASFRIGLWVALTTIFFGLVWFVAGAIHKRREAA